MNRRQQREWLVRLAYECQVNYRGFPTSQELLESHGLPVDNKYLLKSIDCYHDHYKRIDEIIDAYLLDYKMERLRTLDKSILRAAINEILFTKLAPVPVAINEAVEIAKKYSDEPAYKLINGILASLVKDIEAGKYDEESYKK